MPALVHNMNCSLDGCAAAPGDDLGWSAPSDELFRWWLDQERAIGLLLYGRRLWETMSSYLPTGNPVPPRCFPGEGRAESWTRHPVRCVSRVRTPPRRP